MEWVGAVNESQARVLGISRGSRRSAVWEHPFHGVSRPIGADHSDPETRIQNVVPFLPRGAVFTGWAGAFLAGVKYIDGIDRWGNLMPIVLALPDGMQVRPRDGFIPSRRRLRVDEIDREAPLPTATLTRCAYDLALDAPNLTEAVVALDMCTSKVTGGARTTLDNLRSLTSRHKKSRGIVQARHAGELSSERSGSPWESRTRALAVEGAGIDEWLVNVPVFDLHEGFLGVADLLDEESGLVLESDGAGHREERPHQADNVREEKFERAGSVVVRVAALDHTIPTQTIARIRAGRADALRAPKRWTLEQPAWWSAWPPARKWD